MLLTIAKTIFVIIQVLLIFNLMIIVHELGHFLAARWRGLVIEKFGIWFGKPIWKKTINGVEYSLGSIPAGGFVALPQLAPMEVMEGKVETPREQLPPISALDKIIVAFAGPLFSFGLAAVFAVIVWQVGRPVGEAESTTEVGVVIEKMRDGDKDIPGPAFAAGIKPGDKILSVDGHKVTRFGGMGADSIMWRVVRSEGDTLAVEFERDNKVQTVYPQPLVPKKANWWNRRGTRQIGIGPKVSAVLGNVVPGSLAAAAGLQKGDIITAVNGKPLFDDLDIYNEVASAADGKITLGVDRGGQALSIPLQPDSVRVGAVQKGSPAAAAGLQRDDVILSADGQATPVVRRLVDYISTKGGTPVTLHIRRGDKEMDVQVTPQVAVVEATGEKRAMVGLTLSENDGMQFLPMGKYRVVHPRPIEQLRAGVMSIVNTLDAVISKKSSISVQHMGGPVMMMNAYYQMLSGPEGIRMALWFSVVLNVNLALLNLLPIPVLDGGHITLAIIEGLRRKPVNVRLLEYVQSACALVIIGFMIFIAFFDVQDLPFVGGGRSVKFEQATPAAK